jgi:hypothetical protein
VDGPLGNRRAGKTELALSTIPPVSGTCTRQVACPLRRFPAYSIRRLFIGIRDEIGVPRAGEGFQVPDLAPDALGRIRSVPETDRKERAETRIEQPSHPWLYRASSGSNCGVHHVVRFVQPFSSKR